MGNLRAKLEVVKLPFHNHNMFACLNTYMYNFNSKDIEIVPTFIYTHHDLVFLLSLKGKREHNT